ncbi:MAG: hypothetical protein JSS82_10820 [Bacteroidetes bacterium]|nr:hypothetical protein [Bacteroidota bacterium]
MVQAQAVIGDTVEDVPPKAKKQVPIYQVSQPTIVMPVPTREETEHRYLQMLIKRTAEARGFTAKIEEPTPDGKGRIDVLLERDGRKIGVEISVTTSDTWEIHNIEKCLNAGCDTTIVCSNNAKQLKKIKETIKDGYLKQVLLFKPEELIKYLDGEVNSVSRAVKTINGYRIRVEYDTSTVSEMQRKKESILKVISNAINNRKKQ